MTAATPWHATITARDQSPHLRDAGWLAAATAADESLPQIWIDATKRFQTHVGFGAAFTEAAAHTWQQLPPAQRDEVLQACFSPTQGHGYTLCRVHMGSCDFALGHYTHVDVAGDVDLHSFSIERDRQALLPFIRAAQQVAGTPLKLLASPWSPPPWMKTNNAMNGGGRLRPEYRAAWAQYFVRFVQAYEAEGVPIWGVSVQNEPMATQRWDSCLYSAEEERDFVRDHLGPALHGARLGHVKIICWDHNRDDMVQRASVIYSDPVAAAYIWGLGFHWYVEDHFDHVQLVHDAWPDKQLLFTEGCQEGGPHVDEWEPAERYARSVIHDLNRWTVGWIDWNLLLNEQGGPNHVGNHCSAPLLAQCATGALLRQPSYAYLGHFARFIHPGARRVLCAANREALETTAFQEPDGSLVCVVLNRTEAEQHFTLRTPQGMARAALPPHAIGTFCQASAARTGTGPNA